VIAWLLAVLLTLSSQATATSPAQRLNPPPAPIDWAAIDAWTEDGCTRTRIAAATVAATHCGAPAGWQVDGDTATSGPVAWAPAPPPGATIYAIGYPADAHGEPVYYTLTALKPRIVGTFAWPQLVLMAKGAGAPCTSGASGMVAWVLVDGALAPIGPLSVYSTDPAVTSLPAGQYVCGFAIH
jgi:hypothetical protein